MIEKLKLNRGNVKPAKIVMDLIEELKKERKKIIVAEVGVGWGATAVEIIKLLSKEDEYYFFDLDEVVEELYNDLHKINSNEVQLRPYGNSKRYLDSYAWNLAKLLGDKEHPIEFDLVYLDGAHTFMHDGISVCILKEMIREGGYLVLDDVSWSQAKSPTCNPDVNPGVLDCYTLEQIEACQIGMVKNLFLDTDERYEEINPGNSKRRAVFKRRLDYEKT